MKGTYILVGDNQRNHPRKRMIERNISFSEEDHSLLVSWDTYSHAETCLIVHALSFLFAMFKVVVNKEGLTYLRKGAEIKRDPAQKTKMSKLSLYAVINQIYIIFLCFMIFI